MPKKHSKYLIKGKEVPSVTTILGNTLHKPGLQEWYGRLGKIEAERQRDEAASFGDKVHTAIEAHFTGQKMEKLAPRVQIALNNMITWAEVNVDEWLDFEQAVYHDELLYAGTVDAFVRLKSGKICIADFKGLPLETPLPTPNGWSTIQNIKIGEDIFGSDGHIYQVTNKSSIHRRKSFKICFDDGTWIVADDEHLWALETTRPSRHPHCSAVLRTDQIRPEDHWGIKITEALVLEEQDVPIEPYILGCWLGDGCTTDGKITSNDVELFELIAKNRKVQPAPTLKHPRTPTRRIEKLRTDLRNLGLLGNKHIPQQYLRSSIDQRCCLLRGLMDTDGTFNHRRNQAVFVTTLPSLATQVLELVTSLGERAVLWSGASFGFGQRGKQQYRIIWVPQRFNPFSLSRKGSLVNAYLSRPIGKKRRPRSRWRKIIDVVSVDPILSQCIEVNSPDSCYLAGRQMLVTHNTSKSMRDEYHLQVAAYRGATRTESKKIKLSQLEGSFILHLDRNDLTWRPHSTRPQEECFEIFSKTLEIYNWFQMMQRGRHG